MGQADQLLLSAAPTVGIPLATATETLTPTPTFTPTPQPSATPPPTATATLTPTSTQLPPIRLQIPAISLNSRVETLDAEVTRNGPTDVTWEWPDPEYTVGHYAFSGRPSENRNIVLSGHNNWKGEVFRNLSKLENGDTIKLSTADSDYLYTVEEIVIIPYQRDPVFGTAELWKYLGPQGKERLTLFSCYPYATNADRIVVVANPVAVDE